jgi:hypothetical protein
VRSLVRPGWSHYKTVYDPLAQRGNHEPLAVDVILGVGEDDNVALPFHDLSDPGIDRRKERVLDIGHYEPDGASGAGDQGLGYRVGKVAKLLCGLQDPTTSLCTDVPILA